jgi:NAD(P)H-flavin reductase
LRLVGIEAPDELGTRPRVPGQYVVAGRPGGPHGLFVICSPADPTGSWEILVRSGGAAADAIASLPVGASMEVSRPRGPGFPMDRVLNGARDIFLVCAGAGIAALRPVLHAIQAHRTQLDGVRLYHGVETRAHAAFCTEIDALTKMGLAARLCTSQEDAGPGTARGYVQDVLVSDGTALGDAVVVAAGPAGLVRALKDGLPAIGLAAGAVLTNWPE